MAWGELERDVVSAVPMLLIRDGLSLPNSSWPNSRLNFRLRHLLSGFIQAIVLNRKGVSRTMEFLMPHSWPVSYGRAEKQSA